MSLPELNVELQDAAATDRLGEALARALQQAGAPSADVASGQAGALRGAVIHLRGELGTGKTACARSLLRALGVRGLIRSPTYTLVETYAIEGYTCVHADLYRVSGAAAVEELGLRDWVGADALLLIEWPERGAGAVPHADLTVLLSYADAGAGRRARLIGQSAVGGQLLRKLRGDASLAPYLSNFA